MVDGWWSRSRCMGGWGRGCINNSILMKQITIKHYKMTWVNKIMQSKHRSNSYLVAHITTPQWSTNTPCGVLWCGVRGKRFLKTNDGGWAWTIQQMKQCNKGMQNDMNKIMHIKHRTNVYLVTHIPYTPLKILRAAYFGAAYGRENGQNKQ